MLCSPVAGQPDVGAEEHGVAAVEKGQPYRDVRSLQHAAHLENKVRSGQVRGWLGENKKSRIGCAGISSKDSDRRDSTNKSV